MPHSLTNLLSSVPELQQLTQKLAQLEQINFYLTANLDPTLAAHCRVANLRDGSLILSTTSPAWNHKLRFASLDLLTVLRANPKWSGLKSIAVRVDYLPAVNPIPQPASNLKRHKPISANHAQLMQHAAQNITCTKLAQSLHRLAHKLSAASRA